MVITTWEMGRCSLPLKAYNHAFEIAQALAFFYEDTSNVSEKTVSVYDILRKIDDLQDNLNILAISGSGQTGNYGSPLSDPLIVQVQYKEVPLGNFPLQATYIHGIGLLRNDARETDRAIRIYTDAAGTGICWVEAVQSITRGQSHSDHRGSGIHPTSVRQSGNFSLYLGVPDAQHPECPEYHPQWVYR